MQPTNSNDFADAELFRVWCPEGAFRASDAVYRTRTSAEQAAVSLARENPGRTYVVLNAVAAYRTTPPAVAAIRLSEVAV